jgi:maleate cis-trans isomerase
VPGASAAIHRGVDYQFYRLVPTDVMQVSVGIGIRDYSSDSVHSAMDLFWSCVQTLVDEGCSQVVLSGVPVSAGLGREQVLELIEEVPRRHGVSLDATLEAMVNALGFLGARRIAMGSRFPAETNAGIAHYLADAGIEVLESTSREISLGDARQLSLEDGMLLPLQVGREALAHSPEAEALLLPGGATLSLHAIPALEAESGKPVLTNLSAEVWSALMGPGLIPPVAGWGRLLASGARVG